MSESRELLEARSLLSAFEADIASPEAIARLSEALSLLSEKVEEEGAESRIAANIVGVYAAKTVTAAEATLARPGEAAAVEFRHWEELLGEFGRCGFESAPVSASLAKLSKRLATRYVLQMTSGEKEALLKKLEAEEAKRRQ